MKSNPTKKSKDKEKYKTFSEKQLRGFQEVQTWLKTVSEKSGKQYLHVFRNFCNFCGKNPKQLILEEKFRIIFIAQTGIRVSDALELKVSDIQRELELGNVPLAIRFLPKKDRKTIKERITFLASDGIEMLK